MADRRLWMVLAAGLVGGLALGFVAVAWGRTPAGNAALVVPFGGGPALLAGGWTALLLQTKVVRGALAAAALALLAALAAVFAPFLLQSPQVGVVGPLLALAFGFALCAFLGIPTTHQGTLASAAVTLIAVAVILLPSGVGFVVAPLSVPLILVTPLATIKTPGPAVWVSAVAYLVLTVVGLVSGSRF